MSNELQVIFTNSASLSDSTVGLNQNSYIIILGSNVHPSSDALSVLHFSNTKKLLSVVVNTEAHDQNKGSRCSTLFLQ